jgi:hypothetical protein
VCLPPGASRPSTLSEDFVRSLPLRWVQSPESFAAQLAAAMPTFADEPLLVLEADAVVDSRLLRHVGQQAGALVAYGGERCDTHCGHSVRRNATDRHRR